MRFIGGGIVLVLLDQLTKLAVVRHIQPGESLPLLGNVVYLTLVRNPGAAFGLLGYATPFLIIITLLLVGLVWVYRHSITAQPGGLKFGLTLAVGGAVGNLIDRARLGYVIDFVDVGIWPVFNLADMGIVAGVMLLFWFILRTGRGSY